jgi:hypothetical protein
MQMHLSQESQQLRSSRHKKTCNPNLKLSQRISWFHFNIRRGTSHSFADNLHLFKPKATRNTMLFRHLSFEIKLRPSGRRVPSGEQSRPARVKLKFNGRFHELETHIYINSKIISLKVPSPQRKISLDTKSSFSPDNVHDSCTCPRFFGSRRPPWNGPRHWHAVFKDRRGLDRLRWHRCNSGTFFRCGVAFPNKKSLERSRDKGMASAVSFFLNIYVVVLDVLLGAVRGIRRFISRCEMVELEIRFGHDDYNPNLGHSVLLFLLALP